MVEEPIFYQITRVHHMLRSVTDQALRELGISTAKYTALSVLATNPGLSGAALARRCFVTPQTINDILLALEKVRLIERRPHPENRRIRRAFLTEEGEVLLERSRERVMQIEGKILAGLGEEAAEQLVAYLRQCNDLLEVKFEPSHEVTTSPPS